MRVDPSEKSINTNEKDYKNNVKTERILKEIYKELKEETLKGDKQIFIKQYEIPSINYSNDKKLDLWLASGIEMQLERMMEQFDYKLFYYSYKDKYFFSNSQQKAKEIMLKEVEKEVLKEQRDGRLKRRNRELGR